MIRHVWSVLCETRIIDKDTNNLSLINIVEQLNFDISKDKSTEDQPVEIRGVLNVVSMWTRKNRDEPSKGESRVRIKNPDNKYTPPTEMMLDLTNFVRLRSLTSLAIGLNKTGIYSVIIELKTGKKWNEVASIPVEVNINTTVPSKLT